MAPVATESPAATTGTKPVKTFRAHGVSVAIFENHGKNADGIVTFHKASLQKTYKDGDAYKTTSSLGQNDLLVGALLLTRAFEFMQDAKAAKGQEDDGE